jgi:hypothetical protein
MVTVTGPLPELHAVEGHIKTGQAEWLDVLWCVPKALRGCNSLKMIIIVLLLLKQVNIFWTIFGHAVYMISRNAPWYQCSTSITNLKLQNWYLILPENTLQSSNMSTTFIFHNLNFFGLLFWPKLLYHYNLRFTRCDTWWPWTIPDQVHWRNFCMMGPK